MLQHADVWRAIDRLAQKYGLSASGLARRAGLDPTTFNKSKRVTAEGKERWPSTESLAKVLNATGASAAEFVALLEEAPHVEARNLPILAYAQAAQEGHFDPEGRPAGQDWEETTFPAVEDPDAFALEIAGDALEPVYSDGNIIVVSPAAGVRRGDRVVVKTRGGEILAKKLLRQTATRIELAGLSGGGGRQLESDEVVWMSRILWASQ